MKVFGARGVLTVAVVIAAGWATASPALAQSDSVLRWLVPSASIGVTVREVTREDADNAKLAQPIGVFIESVREGSPAARAGFQPGDIVLDVDGERVRSVRHFTRLIEESSPRRVIAAVVVRGTSRQSLDVVPEVGGARAFSDAFARGLGRREPRVGPREFNFDFAQPFSWPPEVRLGPPALGISVTTLSDQLAGYFGVKRGVLVSSVVEGSPAAAAGIRAGDVITAVGGQSVNSATDIASAVRRARDGEGIDVAITRDKQPMTVKVMPSPAQRGSGRRGLPI